MKKILRNIPNILSAYRLLVFPLLLWLIFSGEKHLFIVLLSINLITDILDGLIARIFKLESEFGAKLDSLADISSYIAAAWGMIRFENEFIVGKEIQFIILLISWSAPYIVSFIRFKRPPHFHLYTVKISGYLQGIFIFCLFNFGCPEWYFYVMWIFSLIAFTEELIVAVFIPQLRSNAKGIYWMMKEKGKIE